MIKIMSIAVEDIRYFIYLVDEVNAFNFVNWEVFLNSILNHLHSNSHIYKKYITGLKIDAMQIAVNDVIFRCVYTTDSPVKNERRYILMSHYSKAVFHFSCFLKGDWKQRLHFPSLLEQQISLKPF